MEQTKFKSVEDALLIDLVRNALEAIAKEMSIIMLRSAYSPIFSEGKDFSSALFTPEGYTLAQAHDCPIHLASMGFHVKQCLRQMGGTGVIDDGDLMISNDPYSGGSHLPDITVFKPIFCEGQLVAFAANRAHHSDVGGWSPGSFTADAEEIFQEGLRIPPVRLIRRGQLQEDLLAFVLRNVRDPESMRGDLFAQIAAVNHAEKQIKSQIVSRLGLNALKLCEAPILDASEAMMRREIAEIPDGIYEAQDFVEDDGLGNGPFEIKVKVAVRGDSLEVDFAGTSSQARGPINAPLAVASGATFIAILTMTDSKIPVNEGCYRPVTIKIEEGTFLNPREPAPCVSGNTYTALRVIDTVRSALGKAIPHRATAGNGDHLQFLAGGFDPQKNNAPYSFYEMPTGGWGAGSHGPGVGSAFGLVANCRNVPIEIFESKYPFRINRMQLQGDSCGTGSNRGGAGMFKEYELLRGTARVTLASDRQKLGPAGHGAGGHGNPGLQVLVQDGVCHTLPGKISDIVMKAGDVIQLTAPGGGGWSE
ncbi:hydantoinase B/oxoprolinase family protein [Agrobacterium pusense]|uniref:hydantoinase B/oxoprolinase family protein n=1 Tax=Agrobacterium pusense TaxID=648995 RepID=UPI0035A5F112